MLPFGVTILATVLQSSEIPEGLMNYPVYCVCVCDDDDDDDVIMIAVH